MQLSKRTIQGHIWQVKRFLDSGKFQDTVTVEDIRNYLAKFMDANPCTYRNVIWSLRRFLRDFLGIHGIVERFRVPPKSIQIKIIPNKNNLQKFYSALKNQRSKALFLVYASSGLRKNEVLSLRLEDIDITNRMIIPKKKENNTKHVWISFFNEEASEMLEMYLNDRKINLFFLISFMMLSISSFIIFSTITLSQ